MMEPKTTWVTEPADATCPHVLTINVHHDLGDLPLAVQVDAFNAARAALRRWAEKEGK